MKKIVLFGLILVIAISSLSMVSASQEITKNGVKFNIPDGYHETSNTSTKVVYYDGSDRLTIFVYENDNVDLDHRYANSADHQKTTINGHEGYKSSFGANRISFEYKDNGKHVEVIAPTEDIISSVIPNSILGFTI